jgi:hypothetical protein
MGLELVEISRVQINARRCLLSTEPSLSYPALAPLIPALLSASRDHASDVASFLSVQKMRKVNFIGREMPSRLSSLTAVILYDNADLMSIDFGIGE